MHFQKSALGFLIAALPSGARPTEASTDSALADGSLFVCTDANFSGACINLTFFNAVCSNMPSGFQDNISSFGPDPGWVCITYTDPDCRGTTYVGTYPGFAGLPSGINDAISSFHCFTP
ncbi:hypothetical protein BD779DRAFT_1673163 [Infundibulicybe gibba]|nr:hypothetical protein BD779DRAFT_1673163 [Infundibulicybe gibba]